MGPQAFYPISASRPLVKYAIGPTKLTAMAAAHGSFLPPRTFEAGRSAKSSHIACAFATSR